MNNTVIIILLIILFLITLTSVIAAIFFAKKSSDTENELKSKDDELKSKDDELKSTNEKFEKLELVEDMSKNVDYAGVNLYWDWGQLKAYMFYCKDDPLQIKLSSAVNLCDNNENGYRFLYIIGPMRVPKQLKFYENWDDSSKEGSGNAITIDIPRNANRTALIKKFNNNMTKVAAMSISFFEDVSNFPGMGDFTIISSKYDAKLNPSSNINSLIRSKDEYKDFGSKAKSFTWGTDVKSYPRGNQKVYIRSKNSGVACGQVIVNTLFNFMDDQSFKNPCSSSVYRDGF